MRIISPVDNLQETELLLEAGADELYGGYIPEEWKGRFSLVASINQRTFEGAQIASFDDLAAIVSKVHGRNGTFSLTLNSPFYADAQLPMLVDYVDSAVEAGIDGIILADLGLLRLLRGRHPQLECHASTLAHLSNSEAVKFYASQGAERVIFPRHLMIDEMTAIATKMKNIRFDAFLLVGKCPNTEGLCTFHHTSADKIWPCEIPYTIESADDLVSSALECAMARQGSWSLTNRRHGCGLCAIPSLEKIGIFGLKLVGRGSPASQKISNIVLTRKFIELARSEIDLETYCQKAREAHRSRFGAPCSSNVCYYPEFLHGESLS